MWLRVYMSQNTTSYVLGEGCGWGAPTGMVLALKAMVTHVCSRLASGAARHGVPAPPHVGQPDVYVADVSRLEVDEQQPCRARLGFAQPTFHPGSALSAQPPG